MIDESDGGSLFEPFVQRLGRILSLALLVLWLPVTAHCALEAAGIVESSCHDAAPNADPCATDACDVLEAGHYRASCESAIIAAPDLNLCASLRCLFAATDVRDLVAIIRPPLPAAENWIPQRHFAQRAAPPSRAPAVRFP